MNDQQQQRPTNLSYKYAHKLMSVWCCRFLWRKWTLLTFYYARLVCHSSKSSNFLSDCSLRARIIENLNISVFTVQGCHLCGPFTTHYFFFLYFCRGSWKLTLPLQQEFSRVLEDWKALRCAVVQRWKAPSVKGTAGGKPKEWRPWDVSVTGRILERRVEKALSPAQQSPFVVSRTAVCVEWTAQKPDCWSCAEHGSLGKYSEPQSMKEMRGEKKKVWILLYFPIFQHTCSL